MSLDSISILFILFLISFIVILFYKTTSNYSTKAQSEKRERTTPASVLLVVGSGGHTREIMTLVRGLGNHYSPRYYVIAETDKIGETKVRQYEEERSKESSVQSEKYQIFFIPRSREVGQSYLTSVITTLWSLLFSIPLVFRLKPELILCNGPGTCIPICFVGLVLKWTGLQKISVVFVESLCRVTSLSLSGKILYHLADALFVQWPEMLKRYPKAKYLGRLV